MKNLILIAFVAVLSVCSCSLSSYDLEVIDSWKVWVAGKTTKITDSYWENNPEKKVDVDNLFTEGVRLKHKGTKEIIISHTNIESAYFLCRSELKYSYNSAIKENKQYVSPRDVVSDLLKKGIGLCDNCSNYHYRDSYWYSPKWFIIEDDETITFFTRACVQSVGTFEDMCKYIHSKVSIYSSSLIEREKQYKLYEVIYHIRDGKIDKYVLCDVLIQNDGSSEIEIEETSNNLLDLI